jgi:hypothetical protein
VPVEEIQIVQQPTGKPEPDDVELDNEEMNEQENPRNKNGKQQ